MDDVVGLSISQIVHEIDEGRIQERIERTLYPSASVVLRLKQGLL